MTGFKQMYRCYSVSQTGKHHLESGDKILLPVSVLARLSTMRVEYPLLFQLRNPKTDKLTHCGVMEFSADEGTALLPDWLMSNLGLLRGDLVEIDNASLQKATFIKLQPHQTAFVEVSNPKAVLERTLRGFSCLTVGDTFVIDYLGRKFSIDVCETRPNDRAVSIIDTDCEVDFATPLDYKEPQKVKEEAVEPMDVEEPIKFKPFVGLARRLDGGSTSYNYEPPNNDVVMASPASSNGNRRAGKLVFGGSNSSEDSRRVLKDNKSSDDSKGKAVTKEEEKEKGFKPFSGRSYRLDG